MPQYRLMLRDFDGQDLALSTLDMKYSLIQGDKRAQTI